MSEDIYLGRAFDESHSALQDCRRFAHFVRRGQRVLPLEAVAGFGVHACCAVSCRPPGLILHTGRSWAGTRVFFVCPVWGISGMASGRIGPIHSSSDWRVRMGRLRISGNGDLRHVGGLLWVGAGSFGLHRGLHRLGHLAVDRGTPGAVNTWRPGCIFYGIATITPKLAWQSVRASSALSPKVISRRGTFSAISEPGQKPYVTCPRESAPPEAQLSRDRKGAVTLLRIPKTAKHPTPPRIS